MEKKLRTKFTFLSVIAFFIVLVLISSALIYANYSRINKRADSTIEKIISGGGKLDLPQKKPGDGDKENKSASETPLAPDEKAEAEDPFFNRYFIVEFDKNKELSKIDTSHIYSVTSDEAKAYGEKLLTAIGSTDEKSGFLDNYRYKIKKTEGEYICVFLDSSRDLSLLNDFIKNDILIAAISLICISFISWFLSKRAVSPLVLAYEKQKRFITDASHELKTPLAIISANNDIIEIENGESKWLASNRAQINRLSSMIDMLVALTRLDESSRPAPAENAEPVDISALLCSSIDGFTAMANSQGKSFSVNAAESIISKVNCEEIKKLFSILLENSLKYSVENSVISINLEPLSERERPADVQDKRKTCESHTKHTSHGSDRDQDSASKTSRFGGEIPKTAQTKAPLQHFSLSVENTSENLSKGLYDELFDRFYRLETSRNSEKGGFGIGLSIARAIVEKHGGTIKAYSPDGRLMVITVQL